MTSIGHNSLGNSIETSKNALVSKLHEAYKTGRTTDEQARIDTYNIASHTATWYFNKYLLERATASLITTVSFADAHVIVKGLIGYDDLVKKDKANRSETFEQRVRRGVRHGFTVLMTQIENYRLECKDMVPAYDDDNQPVWQLDEKGKQVIQEIVNAAGKTEKRTVQATTPYERKFSEYSFDNDPFVLDADGKEKTTKNGKKIANKNYRSIMLPECVLVPEKKNEQGVTFKNVDRTPVKATQSAFNGQAKVDFPDAFATAKSGKRGARTPDTGATETPAKLSSQEKSLHGIAAMETLGDFLQGKTTATGNAPAIDTLTIEQYDLLQAAINLHNIVRKSMLLGYDKEFVEMVAAKKKVAKETLAENK